MANVGAARQSRWVRPKPGPKVPSLVLLLSWVGCAVGCHIEAEHADCASIAPGTPVADIPVSGEGFTPYCSPASGASAEVGALWCSREGYFPSNGSVKRLRRVRHRRLRQDRARGNPSRRKTLRRLA